VIGTISLRLSVNAAIGAGKLSSTHGGAGAICPPFRCGSIANAGAATAVETRNFRLESISAL
jgi:hypothetical protein